MKFKKLNLQIGVCLSALFLLSGCGGGGGGGGAVSSGIAPVTPVTNPVGVPTVQTPYTQADAAAIAGLGLLTVESLSKRVLLQQGFFAGFIQGYSTRAEASQILISTNVPCDDLTSVPNITGIGTFSVSIFKSASYRGLKPNDSIQFNFVNCTFPGSGFTLKGRTVLTSAGTYVDQTANSVFAYSLDSINFNYSDIPSNQQNVYNGALSVVFDGVLGGFDFPKLTATASGPYSLAIFKSLTAVTPTITDRLSSATVLNYAPTSSGAYTASLNGDVAVISSGGSTFLKFVTDTQLAGSESTGRQVPTSGVLRTAETSANLSTRATVSGVNVTVAFDSDRNGTLESSFIDTYLNVTAP